MTVSVCGYSPPLGHRSNHGLIIHVNSTISDTTIFLILGMEAIGDLTHSWNTGFVLWTLLFCFVFRFISKCIHV